MNNTKERIEMLETQVRAAEEAWRWARANGRNAGTASRRMHTAIRELRKIEDELETETLVEFGEVQ